MKPIDEQAGFGGGWSVGDPLIAAPDTYQSALNMRIDLNGQLVTRGKTRRTTPAQISAGSIQGGYSWRRSDGTVQQIIECNGQIFTATLDSNLILSGLVSRGGGRAINDVHLPVFAHFRDAVNECVYFVDGTAIGGGGLPVSKWDGTTYSINAFGPAGVLFSSCWVYNGRLYACTANDQLLYYSALNNGDTIGNVAQGGGVLTVRAFGASKLVAGAQVGSSLLLSHQAGISIFRGTTLDDITIDLGAVGLAEGIGALGQHGILKFNTFAYVVTSDGLYLVNEGGAIPIETPERPDPLRRINPEAPLPTEVNSGLNVSTQWYIARHPRFQELWVGEGVVKATYPPKIYNYELKRWVSDTQFAFPGIHHVRCAWDTIDGSGTGFRHLLLGCTDGFVRVVDPVTGAAAGVLDDVNSDGTGGTAFPVSVTARRFWGVRALPDKIWRALNVTAKLAGNSLAVTAVGQNGDSVAGTIAQPPTIGNTDYGVIRYTGMPKSSQYMDVTMAAASSDPKVTIAAIEVEGEVGAERGK